MTKPGQNIQPPHVMGAITANAVTTTDRRLEKDDSHSQLEVGRLNIYNPDSEFCFWLKYMGASYHYHCIITGILK